MNYFDRQHRALRKNTRTRLWPDTKATIKVADPMASVRKIISITGNVGDLGSSGMFLITKESVPVPSKAEITIDFDPSRPSTLVVEALGEVVRNAENGVGIKFTTINMDRLQRCILERMNK